METSKGVVNKIHAHKTHDMTPWRSSIVTLSATPRFGRLRECRNCGGEHAITIAGEKMHDVLYSKCIA